MLLTIPFGIISGLFPSRKHPPYAHQRTTDSLGLVQRVARSEPTSYLSLHGLTFIKLRHYGVNARCSTSILAMFSTGRWYPPLWGPVELRYRMTHKPALTLVQTRSIWIRKWEGFTGIRRISTPITPLRSPIMRRSSHVVLAKLTHPPSVIWWVEARLG